MKKSSLGLSPDPESSVSTVAEVICPLLSIRFLKIGPEKKVRIGVLSNFPKYMTTRKEGPPGEQNDQYKDKTQ